ncbi:MAG TPA: hypothetical protein VFG87_25235 [Amycolatopsis sp.]|nr:hypothetical protein [Amycolatopsis sp.]
MPRQFAAGRHRAGAAPIDRPVRAGLPMLPLDQTADLGYPPARGELPVSRRTTVTLTAETAGETDTGEQARVYAVPPETGLGTFDLGSVPASVTPPRSWRKAAWFATASSGGVMVALLFAGTALVGKPAQDQAGQGWVPHLGGGQPTTGDAQVAAPGQAIAVSPRTTGTTTGSGATLARTRTTLPGTTPAGTASTATGPGRSTGDTAPASPSEPRKPPSTPAPYAADSLQVALPEGDPAVFAKDSQKFLDTVTENPEAAHEMTSGELEKEGAGGLSRRYARVAYFDVEHIQVHQYQGKTVCTVRTVYKDGREATEQHVLTFAKGKIDGMD